MKALRLPQSVPSPADFDVLLAKFKAFRLLALQTAPKSFGSTYAREEALDHEAWVARLTNPLAATIIGVHDDTTTTSDAIAVELLLQNDWLGSATLTGPYDYDAALATLGFHKELLVNVDHVVTRGGKMFFLNAMFVAPAARGLGAGTLVVNRALQVARDSAAGQKVRIILILDFENVAARRTYEKCGFSLVHRYWWDDFRETPVVKTEGAVMVVDLEAK